MIKKSFLLIFFLLFSVKSLFAQGVLVSDSGTRKVTILDHTFSPIFEIDAGNTYDAHLLKNDNILFTSGNSVKEAKSDGSIVFEFKIKWVVGWTS